MKKLLECISNLTEEKLSLLLEFVLQLLPTEEERPCCPHCGDTNVIKYGKKDGKQRFQCKNCYKTFMLTTNTIAAQSHQPLSVWRQFVADTLHLRPLEKSAQELGLSHQCAFDMRHKILFALQDMYQDNPTMLGGVTELDETYVLESYKGKALPNDAGRAPRKHGAKAAKPGLSNEQICVCAGVQRSGAPFAVAVNRAKPSIAELKEAFRGHISKSAMLLCDGLRGYSSLETLTDCEVIDVNSGDLREKSFYNLNAINNFHSFIKEQYRAWRGVATKYLNRYMTLLCAVYRTAIAPVDQLLKCSQRCFYHPIREVKSAGLLLI
jgi:transposase-like protein